MAKKKIKTVIKVFPMGGAATPAPPIGPALGQHGVNIMEFVNQYNKQTQDKKGQKVPAEITIYEDRTFTFVLKLPPVSEMIKQELKLKLGSGEPNKTKVGKLTRAQLEKIATEKMPDLSASTLEAAMKTVAGTARSMGVEVEN
ncbi:MAG: 50S ribosomal protein L11, large subunit ribosomal protein L11 [Microgenomates group bacterium GW2011_GWC1_46_16]|uniref:Large ribosomal subunit protein uL11 n=2 Tax=Candidatus Collieribacteriota TaxID=1752725 RepID=A0A1F5FZI8_9BACT|nr:MAG: 50S ribosomal protein L11 [Microgenomates group bacterium GW2011_GWF1_46_12]KKU26643.1 MAG: 50S ribosomal protein L11, large subunit ribosomal protein L11 [Microgenomates group bacterium GW2011_GWC1_46_16]KKU28102.1 MAG: 50S ribosomal protein L11 [Microgenomates group bacterium GW2011_GWF2_46_18]KKU45767.1 MAG: 50S ribosomal protein L11 [Microgenomates group bacterium GW2011_GWB1_46_7]KKU60507.1 MAG: 50S ribosomal protein L11 [Microgenomates group bacterium GW2011_GWE1_47_12]KKU62861.1